MTHLTGGGYADSAAAPWRWYADTAWIPSRGTQWLAEARGTSAANRRRCPGGRKIGGEAGIRTLGTRRSSLVFETGPSIGAPPWSDCSSSNWDSARVRLGNGTLVRRAVVVLEWGLLVEALAS